MLSNYKVTFYTVSENYDTDNHRDAFGIKLKLVEIEQMSVVPSDNPPSYDDLARNNNQIDFSTESPTLCDRITYWIRYHFKTILIVILSILAPTLPSVSINIALSPKSTITVVPIPETTSTTTTTSVTKSNDVLAIWSERRDDLTIMPSRALITDLNGNVKQITWSAGSDTTAYCSCSVLFKDKIYFIGDV